MMKVKLSRLAFGPLCGLALYALLSYVLVPIAWTHLGPQRRAARSPRVAYTREGFAGDPLNLVFTASPDELARAFHAIGWTRADPTTPRTAARAVKAFLLRRPYPSAPVSALTWGGRVQDLAFERALGPGDRARHHARLWRLTGPEPDGRAAWAAAASLDQAVKVDRRTGRLTHRISPEVDAERDYLAAQLLRAGRVEAQALRAGAPQSGRNGSGDPYRSDGALRLLTLR